VIKGRYFKKVECFLNNKKPRGQLAETNEGVKGRAFYNVVFLNNKKGRYFLKAGIL